MNIFYEKKKLKSENMMITLIESYLMFLYSINLKCIYHFTM